MTADNLGLHIHRWQLEPVDDSTYISCRVYGVRGTVDLPGRLGAAGERSSTALSSATRRAGVNELGAGTLPYAAISAASTGPGPTSPVMQSPSALSGQSVDYGQSRAPRDGGRAPSHDDGGVVGDTPSRLEEQARHTRVLSPAQSRFESGPSSPTVTTQAEYGRMGQQAQLVRYGRAQVRRWLRMGGRRRNPTIAQILEGTGSRNGRPAGAR